MNDEMNDGQSAPRATTASIDRRVERLEIAQGETDKKVDALASDLNFMRKEMGLLIGNLDLSHKALASEVHDFIRKIDNLVLEGYKQQGDLSASPAGRQIQEALNSLKQGKEDNAKEISRIKLQIAYYAGGLGVLAIFFNIFGGTIARAIGLPQP